MLIFSWLSALRNQNIDKLVESVDENNFVDSWVTWAIVPAFKLVSLKITRQKPATNVI